METTEKYKIISYNILIASFLLCLLGLLATYSASALKSNTLFDTPYHFLIKQCLGVLLGFSGIFILFKAPEKTLERIPLPFFLLTSFLLLLVFVPGIYHTAGGASRWINLGLIGIQPSEPAKLALIFLLAKNLSRRSFNVKSLKSVYLVHGLLLGFLSFCLMEQPDFGSTFFVFTLTFAMIFVRGLKLKHLLFTALTLVPVGVWAIISEPYRVKRIFSFLNPIENINHGGFQIVQSYLAFNNGGFLGVGLGASKQKLFYLPEAHTDFILSVLAEEMGFLGLLLVFFLFLYLINLGLTVSEACQDSYKKLLVFGLTCFLGLHVSINVGVVLGLLPTKGSSLPFITSGVSSLLTCLICVGVIARIAYGLDTKETCYSTKKKNFSS